MQESPFAARFVQWLHEMGIHIGPDAARAVGQAVDQGAQAAGTAMQQLDMPGLLALAAALGWASGFRLYAVTFLVGGMGAAGWLALPPGLAVLAHPLVLAVSGFMLLVEFFADKVPWLDSAWDGLNAFVRVPAGALLAAGVFGADSAVMGVAAGLLGGSLAAASFAAKATARAAINTSPEPFSNWLASLFEDGLVIAVVWLATQYPLAFGIALAVMVLLAIALIALLFKFFKAVLRRLRRQPQEAPAAP
ncbi:DUF4126 domain-containing protein [Vandammella animalimorsus]|uniref:DUF4126 domain-containing protein n=1 Tax=Vandammella animalimorsus TaxID=2029117 RepID=A0A2A2AIL9_9BURK|nr:DUF4126 domain-containing protein [Vandammella animalimorsus]PAT37571.1 hypothetical protein CK625_04590 [Vandammella animalimorsus]